MKIGILLSGSGVYDGSEIHEAVFTMLSIAQHGAELLIFAPNTNQHHVINHITGEEMNEQRNVLIESARIARGNIKDLEAVTVNDFDALVIPGGFGAAKNITKWAFSGPDGEINSKVKSIILNTIKAKKPIAALCMGPTVIAKALENSGLKSKLTVGTTSEKSPYDIASISEGMEKLGAVAEMKSIKEISVDIDNKIITAPCYMMEASINEVFENIKMTIDKLFDLLKNNK